MDEPEYNIQIVHTTDNMDLYHGNVVSTLIDNYEIIASAYAVKEGYCVVLKTVNSVIGYNDFLVNINEKHKSGTCSYNITLEHEKKHINAYLSVIKDFKSELKNSLFNAADSIMPIFVKSKEELDLAIDKMNLELQKHPELILVKQKIKAAEEIRNKKIDQQNDSYKMISCED